MAPTQDITWADMDRIPAGFVNAAGLAQLKAEGWSVNESGFNKEFRETWTLWHSLREFVQNALDETGEVAIGVDRTAGRVMTLVADNGKGFDGPALRFRQNKGRNEHEKLCLRGRFGEGMKLGFAPVIRAGGRVLIRTIGFDATFVDSEIMIRGKPVNEFALLTRDNHNEGGTIVAIEGLDAERQEIPSPHGKLEADITVDMRRRFIPTLVALDPRAVLMTAAHPVETFPGRYRLEEIPDCQERQLLSREHAGEFFVRDVYIEKIANALFGYHLWFPDAVEAIGNDRDRLQLAPNNYKLGAEMSILLGGLNTATLTEYLRAVVGAGESRSWEWGVLESMYEGGGAASLQVAQRWMEAVAAVVGTRDFSWAEPTDHSILEHLGIKNLFRVIPHSILNLLQRYKLIKTVDEARSIIKVADKVYLSEDVVEHLINSLQCYTAGDIRAVEEKYIAPPRTDVSEYEQERRQRARAEFYKEHPGAFAYGDALGTLARRLSEIADVLLRNWRDPGTFPVRFYIDMNEPDDAKVGGFCHYPTGSGAPIDGFIGIKLTQFASERVLRTFLHECAHAMRASPDLKDSFVSDLEDIAAAFAAWARAHPSKYDSLLASISLLTSSGARADAYMACAAKRPVRAYGAPKVTGWKNGAETNLRAVREKFAALGRKKLTGAEIGALSRVLQLYHDIPEWHDPESASASAYGPNYMERYADYAIDQFRDAEPLTLPELFLRDGMEVVTGVPSR